MKQLTDKENGKGSESETTLLIQGVKGKFDAEYNLIDIKITDLKWKP